MRKCLICLFYLLMISQAYALDYDKALADINAQTEHTKLLSLFNNDYDINNLVLGDPYKRAFEWWYFVNRSEAKYASTVRVWCNYDTGFMTSYYSTILFRISVYGSIPMTTYLRSENSYAARLAQVQDNGEQMLAQVANADQQTLSGLVQQGVFDLQLQLIESQLQFVEDEMRALAFLDWYAGMLRTFTNVWNNWLRGDYQTNLECPTLGLPTPLKNGAFTSRFSKISLNVRAEGIQSPTVEEYNHFREPTSKWTGLFAAYYKAWHRRMHSFKIQYNTSMRRKTLEKFVIVLLARKKYYELIKQSFASLTDSSDGPTNSGAPINFPSPSTPALMQDLDSYFMDNIPTLGEFPETLPEVPKMPSFALNMPGFGDLGRSLNSARAAYNRDKNVESYLKKEFAALSKARKAGEKWERNGKWDKLLKEKHDKWVKSEAGKKAGSNELEAYLKKYQTNEFNQKQMAAYFQNFASNRPAEKKSEVKTINNPTQVKSISDSGLKPLLIPRIKIDDSASLVSESSMSQEQLAMIAKQYPNEGLKGNEISTDRETSIFKIIHQRYLKSVPRLFELDK